MLRPMFPAQVCAGLHGANGGGQHCLTIPGVPMIGGVAGPEQLKIPSRELLRSCLRACEVAGKVMAPNALPSQQWTQVRRKRVSTRTTGALYHNDRLMSRALRIA